LSTAAKESDRPSPSSFPEASGLGLVVRDLRFGDNGPYGFGVGPGRCLGVSGPSGIGKSLLLRALVDLDRHQGDVSLGGRSCESYPAPQWRRLVALVPAEPRWWYSEVGRHLPPDSDAEEVAALVEGCGFSRDVLGWQVSRLSTGEKQRLAVVRALIRRPSVLLLDETGSALDEQAGRRLEQVIADYRRNHQAPVLWVSHDHSQLERVADHVLLLGRDRLQISPLPRQEAIGR
jgi:ABC-type iron transport system FetAB ATPase subunit